METRVITFNENSSNWNKNRRYNIMFLRCTERYMNCRLKLYGHVFLKEVYEYLGFEVTRDSYREGWIYDSNEDNYIDFGINPRGTNPNVKLTFKVENIIDKFKA